MLDLICVLAERYPTVVVDSAYPGMTQDLQQRGVDALSINFRTELPKMISAITDAINLQSVDTSNIFRSAVPDKVGDV